MRGEATGEGHQTYFVLYCSSVQAVVSRSRGPTSPRPAYVQSDSEMARMVFAPAHFVAGTSLRRGILGREAKAASRARLNGLDNL